MSDSDLDEFAVQWRTNLQSGTMDKRKAVFRQLIDTATFEYEQLTIVPNLASPTGTDSGQGGVPTGIRTPVAAVKGRCPRPLDDGDVRW